jgi:uncharacterized protein YukE
MSGADVINVQFAALQNAASSLSQKANALNGHIDELQTGLKPLVDTWVASGSSAGQAAQQSEHKLQAAAADIIEVINAFSRKVIEAHDTQLSLERQNTGYFGG